MIDPLGADDSPNGALSSDERAALAAWADEGDASDGFTDKVLTAWLAERSRDGLQSGVDSTDELGHEAVASAAAGLGAELRPIVGGSAARRMVGWVAALSAAAVVMLMVRVLPRASEVHSARAGACDPAAANDDVPMLAHAGRIDEPSTASPEPQVGILGAQAAAVLAHHCSPCHDSTDPGAKDGALQIFDLEQPYWWPTMSDTQLEDARARVRALSEASDDERRQMDAFVDAELRRRARAG